MAYLVHCTMNFDGETGIMKDDIAKLMPREAITAKIDSLPNLIWKIWAVCEDHPEHPKAIGMYLYPTREAAEARAVQLHETMPLYKEITNVKTDIYDIMDDYSLANHAPIDLAPISERFK